MALAGVDQLQGRFRAETFSARFEGGYRFATPFVGITPYAAAQAISFNLPGYAEQSLVGNGQFALNYTSQTTTATRTELGLRGDKSIAMRDAVLTLRGRAAWAHDYNPDRAVTAVFQTLPGASFVVNGARANPDAALVSAGAEMKWLSGFSLMANLRGRILRQCHELCRQGRRPIHVVRFGLRVALCDAAVLLVALPLPGNAEHDPDPAGAAFGQRGGLRHLHVELIDEQERHADLEVVEQLLQAGCSISQLTTRPTKPSLAWVPSTSTCDDWMVPPTLPTAVATRCSSAAPATVTVGPSRNGVPGRSADAAPLPRGLRPCNWSSRSAVCASARC